MNIPKIHQREDIPKIYLLNGVVSLHFLSYLISTVGEYAVPTFQH